MNINRRALLACVPVPLTAGCLDVIRDGGPERPEITVVTEEVAGRDVVVTQVQSVGQDGVTVTSTIEVDNTANENVGGEVESVTYTAFWSEDESGPWTELGPGEMDPFSVPAGDTVWQDAETMFTRGQPVAELTAYVGTGNTAYLRLTGTASVSIGALNVDVPFETVKAISV